MNISFYREQDSETRCKEVKEFKNYQDKRTDSTGRGRGSRGTRERHTHTRTHTRVAVTCTTKRTVPRWRGCPVSPEQVSEDRVSGTGFPYLGAHRRIAEVNTFCPDNLSPLPVGQDWARGARREEPFSHGAVDCTNSWGGGSMRANMKYKIRRGRPRSQPPQGKGGMGRSLGLVSGRGSQRRGQRGSPSLPCAHGSQHLAFWAPSSHGLS